MHSIVIHRAQTYLLLLRTSIGISNKRSHEEIHVCAIALANADNMCARIFE